ncbi:MAG TPA: dTDP-4-dehydrorhamnose reductase [Rhizomicrobium sp.]|jgi:dTDP-4-dehydrorhamnose reductase|nr:dTDP-4-dehydrorhamnose reductase [Rhizomicrobium sp.]
MRILIFGKTGQVGRELERAVWAADASILQWDRSQCDLALPSRVAECVLEMRPDIVINAAAYTAVDLAESEPELAGTINRDAPRAMAEACRSIGAKLVHLSTDYVFDGSKRTPYVESDPVAPLSVYGRSKEEGETAIRSRLPEHVILRTSWVFAAHGSNFVRTMLRLARERPELRIVADQRGAPTAARDIARAIAAIAHAIASGRGVWGTFHFASDQPISWFGFAETIFALRGGGPKLLPIATEEYKTPARRPLYSVLDCGRLAAAYGIAQPSWRLALGDVLGEVYAEASPKTGSAE